MNAVTLDHVCQALSSWTGIPAERLRPGGMAIGDPHELRAPLAAAILGQDDAIDVAVRAMSRRARLGPRTDERRPLWTALFAGPSGVGKSQLARELCRVFFGDADRHFVHIDLSDFRDEHTVARLVGAPPGYAGHGEGGELTNALRRVPAGVLLLDEVEKAHPAVVTQVLLPLLGDASVHDMNDGRALDASQFVIIMTSNLGAGNRASKPVGFEAFAAGADSGRDSARAVRQAIASFFPREVLGRIDDIVVFAYLSGAAVRAIWEAEIASLSARLSAAGPPTKVEVDDEVAMLILRDAEPAIRSEGARAIRKLVGRTIADRCLELLGNRKDGGRILVQHTEGGQFRFRIHSEPRG